MINKLTTRFTPAAAACLLVVSLGLALWVTTAHASPSPAFGRACEMQSAKNVSAFPTGTSFTIRNFHATYVYTCNDGRWDEVITSKLPPAFGAHGAVLMQSEPNDGGAPIN